MANDMETLGCAFNGQFVHPLLSWPQDITFSMGKVVTFRTPKSTYNWWIRLRLTLIARGIAWDLEILRASLALRKDHGHRLEQFW